MSRFQSVVMLGVFSVMLVAGCLGGGASEDAKGQDAGESSEGDGALLGLRFLNYSAPHVVGEARSQEFDDTVPAGYSDSPVSCCTTRYQDASDLFATPNELVQVRIVLEWTNGAGNSADLGISACLPFHGCQVWESDNQALAPGPHREEVVFETGNYDWWEADYRVGVRVRELVASTGVDYKLTVDVVPVFGAIGQNDPYAFTVPEDSQLLGRVLRPIDEGAGEAVLAFFDRGTDRVVKVMSFAGTHGAEVAVDLPSGDYVAVSMRYGGAYVSLHVETTNGSLDASQLSLRLLEEEVRVVEVLEVPVPTTEEGSLNYEAPPGTYGLYPDFQFEDGAQVQMGWLGSGAGSDFRGALKSSSGVLYDVRKVESGVQATGIRACISCSGSSSFDPLALMDDDGTYTLDYRVSEARGTVVLYVWGYAPGS